MRSSIFEESAVLRVEDRKGAFARREAAIVAIPSPGLAPSAAAAQNACSMLDEATLKGHLDRLGWTTAPYGEATFRSVHATEEGEMVVYLRLHANWFVASVVPFLATKGDNSFELGRWLLRMNRDMPLAKFAYDEDGDVSINVELPTENLDYSELKWALEELLDRATVHRGTLRSAAEGA